jgi:D-aminopeptidase
MSATSDVAARVEKLAAILPKAFPGPGGAVAVLKDGEVLLRHTWGYANSELRIAFTPKSLFRICSISKQFTCALALDAFPDLSALDHDIKARLPHLQQAPPRAIDLAHNQSGLRDYWAVAMLHGAPAELPFGEAEANRVIAGARSLQFTPGSRYSYCNQNFRLLGDAVSRRLDRSFADLLRERIFGPAGMERAFLAADTRALPDGTEGYEGDVATGFRPARNNLIWTGDAGIGASLDDMIAWERVADAGRNDPASVYGRLSQSVTFADGALAAYSYGLARLNKFGRSITGHGGALRGWRSNRFYSPVDRVSVVVMFNHLSDAGSAALQLMAAAIGDDAGANTEVAPLPEQMRGAWIEPQTGLSVRLSRKTDTCLNLRFGHHGVEVLTAQSDGSATDGETRLEWRDGGLWMDRPKENQRSRLVPLASFAASLEGCAGRYRCGELDAEITITDAGNVLYGGFSGFLGQSRMELLEPIGPDVWALPCPRALDHTPPGDWTLVFNRAGGGKVTSIILGCWLARGLAYERVN